MVVNYLALVFMAHPNIFFVGINLEKTMLISELSGFGTPFWRLICCGYEKIVTSVFGGILITLTTLYGFNSEIVGRIATREIVSSASGVM